ncbi:ArnT family glycosyltransferase [Thalassospira alkalitolerans]|uniref:ArnT family glycosyltransferase n=1 Tax=Thalassospira alkalitolerans TaxID=1293890 RepID=UPI003AA88CAC
MVPTHRLAALKSPLACILVLWALGVIFCISVRPLMPVDETRYLSVAWEMWIHGNWLVPHLNGAPYAHKPPMLFWLINVSWAVFGVNEFSARMIAPIFGALNLVMVSVLAGKLWPEKTDVRVLAPLFLVGSSYFAGYGTLTYFDMLQSFFALLGWYGVLTASQGRVRWGWALVGIAIGLGILSKGPVILLYILPAALLAPLWQKRDQKNTAALDTLASISPVDQQDGEDAHDDRQMTHRRWKGWYLGLVVSVLLGAAIALCWAVPAGIYGGEEYRNAIFWGQTAGRMVDSFAHVEPFYYYLVALPLMLLPWLLWGGLWRGIIGFRWRAGLDDGLRMVLLIIVVLMIAFSLISGKRVHYILPVLPLISLVLARVISASNVSGVMARRIDLVPIAVFVILIGLVAIIAPFLPLYFAKAPAWLVTLNGWWGLVLVVAGAVLIVAGARRGVVYRIAIVNFLLVVTVCMIAAPRLNIDYDMRPLAEHLKTQQDEGRDIAYWGKYHAQFQFLGRLQRPIQMLISHDEMLDWAKKHPDGEIIARRDRPLDAQERPLAGFDYKNDRLLIWDIQTVLENAAGVLAR